MKINHCLILAAGFGTRMGKIGQSLPKVLWPIFEKPLIELQILYAKRMGIKNIYINVHHQREQIITFLNTLNDSNIKILVEEDILDIGGAIHNLANQDAINYEGNLLILNSDQFLFFDEEYIKLALQSLKNHQAALFAIKVDKQGKYNQIKFDNQGKMLEIVQFQNITEDEFWTYSGSGIVNLSKLKPIEGKTSFFESVAPYKLAPVKIIPLEELHYWDFGTLARYQKSMHTILEIYNRHESEPFIDFLIEEGSFIPSKVDHLSYDSKIKNVIKLGHIKGEIPQGSIVLGNSTDVKVEKPCVFFQEVYEELS